ncbi:MAG: class I SAM-dependent methyltransferase [Gammaproteobacteria bacterium]
MSNSKEITSIPQKTLAERILIAISLPPQNESSDQNNPLKKDLTDITPLILLRSEYQGFDQLVRGKKVLDFGCGDGYQAAELAKHLDCKVTGVDNEPERLAEAQKRKEENQLNSERLELIDTIDASHHDQYDIVMSHNSMEHFSDPVFILKLMRSTLKPDGRLLITFGPPWYAPFGSHMQYFCKVPWINLVFSEKTIMSVRSLYRNDGAEYYKDIKSGLNQMSLKKFETLAKECDLHIEHAHYTGVKNLNFLTRIPYLRELFTNQVSVIVKKS